MPRQSICPAWLVSKSKRGTRITTYTFSGSADSLAHAIADAGDSVADSIGDAADGVAHCVSQAA